MNCRTAQQLISPYLDQQLTGAEMLAMQQHLEHCSSCAEEYRQVREVRLLLRSLASVVPGKPIETQIVRRVSGSSALEWNWKIIVQSSQTFPAGPWQIQRGPKLAGALALACIALLMIAAPFAPSAGDTAQGDRAGQSGVIGTVLAQDSVMPSASAMPRLDGASGFWHPPFGAAGSQESGNASSATGRTLSQSGATMTMAGWSAEPLDDEAVGGYAAGDAASAETAGR